MGTRHESWEDAASELDQCRLSQRRAQEAERQAEADARARERRYCGAGGGGGSRSQREWFEDDYYPTESDDDDSEPFDFYGPFSGSELCSISTCDENDI